jgi:hypothetical protein
MTAVASVSVAAEYRYRDPSDVRHDVEVLLAAGSMMSGALNHARQRRTVRSPSRSMKSTMESRLSPYPHSDSISARVSGQGIAPG